MQKAHLSRLIRAVTIGCWLEAPSQPGFGQKGSDSLRVSASSEMRRPLIIYKIYNEPIQSIDTPDLCRLLM